MVTKEPKSWAASLWKGNKTAFFSMKETKLAEITPLACRNSCQQSEGQPNRLNLSQNGFSVLAGVE